MKRREFIVIPAKALGGLMLYSLVGELIPAPAQDAVKVPLRFFTAAEAQVVQAACERIFPSDDSGPGATEAGVVIYIDRQLASPYGKDKYRYTKGPWVESIPEHGYQGKETPQQVYRAGSCRWGLILLEYLPSSRTCVWKRSRRFTFFSYCGSIR